MGNCHTVSDSYCGGCSALEQCVICDAAFSDEPSHNYSCRADYSRVYYDILLPILIVMILAIFIILFIKRMYIKTMIWDRLSVLQASTQKTLFVIALVIVLAAPIFLISFGGGLVKSSCDPSGCTVVFVIVAFAFIAPFLGCASCCLCCVMSKAQQAPLTMSIGPMAPLNNNNNPYYNFNQPSMQGIPIQPVSGQLLPSAPVHAEAYPVVNNNAHYANPVSVPLNSFQKNTYIQMNEGLAMPINNHILQSNAGHNDNTQNHRSDEPIVIHVESAKAQTE